MSIVNIIQQGPVSALRNAETFYDIDETRDDYLQILKKEYAIDVPDYISADKRLLYKYIKDFYQTKGTDSSFRFLFRIFFDEEIEVYYPSKNVLRTSDGKWRSDKTLKLSRTNYDPYTCISKKITGNLSGASGVVDSITLYQDGPNEVYEVLFAPGTVYGEFDPDDLISWDSSSAEVFSTVVSFNVTTPGTGYSVGDIVHVTDQPSGASGNVVARIADVDIDGGVKKIESIVFGSGYAVAPSVDLSGLGDGNAVVTANTGTVCKYPGYYVGVDGQLSENIKLQDSLFYQAYSYVIRSGRSIDTWRNLVKQMGHPAGYALFGEAMVNGVADISSDDGFISTIYIDRTGVTWTNNSSQVVPWFNKYNNQVTWANS